MTILDQVRDTFKDTAIGTILSTKDIKFKVNNKFGTKFGSIIPSGYCYNRTNKDKENNNSLKKFNIFIFIKRGKYEYVGENYKYLSESK